MSELDKELQTLALTDWQRFVRLVGVENIKAAKTCLLRNQNYSLGEIAVKQNITKRQVQYACEKCPE